MLHNQRDYYLKIWLKINVGVTLININIYIYIFFDIDSICFHYRYFDIFRSIGILFIF